MIAWLNGQFIDIKDAKISVLDRGFLLADGAFETMLFEDMEIKDLSYHILRFRNILSELLIPQFLDEIYLKEIILKLTLINNIQKGAVRMTVSRGIGDRGLHIPNNQKPNFTITVTKLDQIFSPVNMYISSYIRNDKSPLSNFKTLDYTNEIMALFEARKNGFDEALILNTGGKVCCASSSNIFCILEDALVTPDLSQGCLSGIVRLKVLQIAKKIGIPTEQRVVSIDDLFNAKTVFLTNSIFTIRMVSRCNNTNYILENEQLFKIQQFLG